MLTGNAQFTNLSNASRTITMVVGLYDHTGTDGALVSFSYNTRTLAPGETGSLSAGFKLPEAIAGEPKIIDKLKAGYTANGKPYKVHLDGYDQSEFLRGKSPKSARKTFLYCNDDGELVGMRYEQWKLVFQEQRAQGTLEIWAEPFTKLRLPKIYNLFTDPFERADITSNTYWDWFLDHDYFMFASFAVVNDFCDSLKAFPPRALPQSFTPTGLMERTMEEIRQKRQSGAADGQ